MKKNSLLAISLFSVTFLLVFLASYKKSAKFKRSVKIAFIFVLIIFSSSLSSRASDNWLPNGLGADAFTPPAQHSRSAKGQNPLDAKKRNQKLNLLENEETPKECAVENGKLTVRVNLSNALSKASTRARKNPDVRKGLDKLRLELAEGIFTGGRSIQKLKGSKSVLYLRSGGEARLYFRYVKNEKNVVEILAECDKSDQPLVIKNLLERKY